MREGGGFPWHAHSMKLVRDEVADSTWRCAIGSKCVAKLHSCQSETATPDGFVPGRHFRACHEPSPLASHAGRVDGVYRVPPRLKETHSRLAASLLTSAMPRS